MEASILARRDRLTLDNGMQLRLLSALEVLQARREAEGLAQAPRERALCSNACLLARALETPEGGPVFSGGGAAGGGDRRPVQDLEPVQSGGESAPHHGAGGG